MDVLNEVSKGKGMLTRKEVEFELLKQNNKQIQKEKQELRAQIKELASKEKRLSEKNHSYERALTKTENSLSKITSTAKRLEQDNKRLKDKLSNANSDVDAISKKYSSLKKQLHQSEKSVFELKSLRPQLEALKSERDAARAECRIMKHLMNQLRHEKETMSIEQQFQSMLIQPRSKSSSVQQEIIHPQPLHIHHYPETAHEMHSIHSPQSHSQQQHTPQRHYTDEIPFPFTSQSPLNHHHHHQQQQQQHPQTPRTPASFAGFTSNENTQNFPAFQEYVHQHPNTTRASQTSVPLTTPATFYRSFSRDDETIATPITQRSAKKRPDRLSRDTFYSVAHSVNLNHTESSPLLSQPERHHTLESNLTTASSSADLNRSTIIPDDDTVLSPFGKSKLFSVMSASELED
eukprot:TRINITY_DN488_c0_g1_i1.p1 TRINITY_DN488_c0_g1~~TRINITY_DN488_c0_g1_i1.p1  ORF type:complete len:405 (+),score=109.95 TRINITY_DN488_c0_g1_i1:71-1285(+)